MRKLYCDRCEKECRNVSMYTVPKEILKDGNYTIALDKQKSELCGGSSVARTLREYFEEQRRYEAPTAEVK